MLAINRKIIFILILILKIYIVTGCINSSKKLLKLDKYLTTLKTKSNFIEKNYINPKNVAIKFPEKKQNLIYIIAESLESTFFSKNFGGIANKNILKLLTNLTKNNINFSNTSKFGGAQSLNNSECTTAVIVEQTLGIPLKLNKKIVNYEYSHKHILKNAYGIGNILEKEGYFQLFLTGTDKKYGNKDSLLENHGQYIILDYFKAIEKGYIDKEYRQNLGFEDSKLFDIAKEKILKIADKKVPFNVTILATNTHYPEGYFEKNYEKIFDNKYLNALYYSSMEINSFIQWLKKQQFYKDTTVIISGAYLNQYENCAKFNNNEYRTIYNLFINSKAKPIACKNRKFTQLDMLPSTIASLGAKIDGDRLGLGTNLFSNRKTLAEKFGIDFLKTELEKESLFYNFKLLY